MQSAGYSLKQLTGYFLKLGATGFGGPVALVNYMHRDLVEKRQWISEQDFKEGVALAQLAPGPLAAQLAIYIGFVHYGVIGATVAGIAFVLPSFIMVMLLGIAYVHYGSLPWMQAVFYGVGSAVIGIIAISSYRLTRKNLGKEWMLWAIFLTLAIVTYVTENENIWLILAAGVAVWLYRSPLVKTHRRGALLLTPFLQVLGKILFDGKLAQMAWFFLKAGAFVFGSGLAIVPFLYGGLVKEYHWLSEQQFLDAVAVAMITPGPVVITVGFIGYLVSGMSGAFVAALATFLPCYLFTILPAPYFKKFGKKPALKAFVDGVTAAAIGAIAGAVCVLAKRQITDVTTAGIAITTILILAGFKKIAEPWIILAAAVAGLALKL